MKVLEFQTRIPGDGVVKVPPDISAQILDNDQVRVVLFVGKSTEDEAWRTITAERFLAGYAESDAIYDNSELLTTQPH
jgi:hypothetical protein